MIMDTQNTDKKDKRAYSKHGLTALRRDIHTRKSAVLDRRYKLGREIHAWKQDLIADLGGNESISTQKKAILEVAVRAKLMLDSIDSWILQQPSLVNKRARALLPVVVQRQTLADGLARNLKDLGLERKAKEIDLSRTLAEIKNEEEGKPQKRE
jgi:hypothetical protein